LRIFGVVPVVGLGRLSPRLQFAICLISLGIQAYSPQLDHIFFNSFGVRFGVRSAPTFFLPPWSGNAATDFGVYPESCVQVSPYR
jgi:hypothetical protein